MIRLAFSQAFRLCSKINKWQEVRHLKFQHGLPHIGLQHVVIGANAGAGVVSVVQGTLGKEAEKGSVMDGPSSSLDDHKLMPWPYSTFYWPNTAGVYSTAKSPVGCGIHTCSVKILNFSTIQKKEDSVMDLNLACL